MESPKIEAIGHKAQVEALTELAHAGRAHHAYLFAGPAHVGKAHVARQFLGSLLETGPELERNPDAIVVARELNQKTKKMRELISIEQIHKAREAFARSSMRGGYKVMLIEDADKLSESAANALLKTLEEPSGKACIVLTAADPQALLPTIRSRTQKRTFGFVDHADIAAAVNDAELATLAQGAPGLAVKAQKDEDFRERLEQRYQAARACMDASVAKRVLAARDLIPSYKEDHVVTRAELLERLTVFESLAHAQMLNASPEPDTLSTEQAYRALKGLKETRRALKMHVNPKLTLIHLMHTIA